MSIVAAAMPRILIGFAFLVVVAVFVFVLLSSHHIGLRSNSKTMLLITLANLEQVVCAKKNIKCVFQNHPLSAELEEVLSTHREKIATKHFLWWYFFSCSCIYGHIVGESIYIYVSYVFYLFTCFFFSFVSHMSRSCETIWYMPHSCLHQPLNAH